MAKGTKKSLQQLLRLYDMYVQLEYEKFDRMMLKARKRIIAGHKKYGTDWREKDNLAEIEFEELDIVNYRLLHKCQRHIKRMPDKGK